MQPPARAVRRYLSRIRRRAGAAYAMRALATGGGAASLAFALAGTVVGPVASAPTAAVAWLGVITCAAVGAAWALRPAWTLAGGGAARLLAHVDRELSSAARSALELDADVRARALAPGLVRAHADRVQAALVQIPTARVVPRAWFWRRSVVLGVIAAATAACLLVGVDRASSGGWALVHPAQREDAGLRVAAVVGSADVHLTFPGYLERAPVDLEDPATIEVPRGTRVDLVVTTRIGAQAGVARVGAHEVRLVPDHDGRLAGRFVVREDGDLRIRVEAPDGRWLVDPTRRTIRSIADAAPRISMVDPDSDATVEPRERLAILWEATDDVGLRAVHLVVRSPDGREMRRALARYDDAPVRDARGQTQLVAASLDARPGDQLQLWLEARDGDEVAGPNEGRSPVRIVTVASDVTRRAALIGDLSELLDTGLGALADRLENPVPREQDAASRRHDSLAESGEGFAEALREAAIRARGRPRPNDASLIDALAQRLRRLLTRESRLHSDRPAPRSRRTAVDGAIVDELQRGCLLIADLLGRARLEDVGAMARELDALQRQMSSLLAELRRTDAPGARRALMAAIARAQARMRDISQRISAMAQDVPGDFLNPEALPQRETRNALKALRDAVEAGDLAAAELQLAELRRQIDALAAQLGGGADSFREARFGPRDRAMAEAMDALAGLEAEQGQLARRTNDLRREAAHRALAAVGSHAGRTARRLGQRAVEARQSLLDALDGRDVPADDEKLERMRQRLDDVVDALSTGDLGEARRMAEEATSEAEDISRDLDVSALMFPEARDDAADSARSAEQATDRLRDLQRDIDRAIPRLGELVGEAGRHQMSEDARRQGRAAAAVQGLARRFAQGPDGTPLAPDADASLRRAAEEMAAGGRGLRRGDPIEAWRQQEAAARRLTELREELEHDADPRPNEGSTPGRGGVARLSFDERVHIPGPADFEGPIRHRRRILDAMREGAPAGFVGAVRRYYEELLR